MNAKIFFTSGAVFGFLAVAAGAFGAHSLKTKITHEMLAIFETAARYQMYHALALLAAAWATIQFPHRAVNLAGGFFIAGTLVFSGSLYLLVFSGVKMWGAVTPLGGLLLLAGWASLATGVLLHR